MRLTFPIGLPGSGKTYETTKLYDSLKEERWKRYGKSGPTKAKYVDIDLGFNGTGVYYAHFCDRLRRYCSNLNTKHLIIDGFVPTLEFIKAMSEIISSKLSNIDIIYFMPDKEICLYNDKYRRDKNSKITIENTDLIDPNEHLSEIKELFGCDVKIVSKQSKRKSDYQMFLDKYGITHNFRSDTWSGGGTSGSCWSNTLTTISSGESVSFDDFDSLIEQIDPTISFLQYKKIYNNCVSEGEFSDSDYYGGTEYRKYWECDTVELFNILSEIYGDKIYT
jgi:adenylate kinase family enzyme